MHSICSSNIWNAIGPTSQRNTGDWSFTGGYGQAQPDNREAAQGKQIIGKSEMNSASLTQPCFIIFIDFSNLFLFGIRIIANTSLN